METLDALVKSDAAKNSSPSSSDESLQFIDDLITALPLELQEDFSKMNERLNDENAFNQMV